MKYESLIIVLCILAYYKGFSFSYKKIGVKAVSSSLYPITKLKLRIYVTRINKLVPLGIIRYKCRSLVALLVFPKEKDSYFT